MKKIITGMVLSMSCLTQAFATGTTTTTQASTGSNAVAPAAPVETTTCFGRFCGGVELVGTDVFAALKFGMNALNDAVVFFQAVQKPAENYVVALQEALVNLKASRGVAGAVNAIATIEAALNATVTFVAQVAAAEKQLAHLKTQTSSIGANVNKANSIAAQAYQATETVITQANNAQSQMGNVQNQAERALATYNNLANRLGKTPIVPTPVDANSQMVAQSGAPASSRLMSVAH